ncbi:MAG TPA: hypothetical protein DD735_11330 [Clostridiales bacterium]|nr:hypothetical protein [Clostridiales bacterium]
MWEIYDTLLSGLPENERVTRALAGDFWTLAETDSGGLGLAMTTPWNQRPPMFPGGVDGLPVSASAGAVKSWNLEEAGLGMAAANAYYNTPARMAALGAEEPYGNYCTRGLDLSGKTVGIVGHLKMPAETLLGARQVYILERNPQPGDWPDSACDFLLPECDVVLITGSTLVNKTLPHLMALCKNACTILTGPTVPMCPALLNLGFSRLAGMIVTDAAAMRAHVQGRVPGPPYPFGKTFLLKGD